MYSAFWEEVYSNYFEGDSTLVPLMHSHLNLSHFRVLGSILSHCYLATGILPIKVAVLSLVAMLLGPSVDIPESCYIDALFDYIGHCERKVLKEAIAIALSFSSELCNKLLSALCMLGCRKIPTPANIIEILQHIAIYEFIVKPSACITAINAGIPTRHRQFWEQKSVDEACLGDLVLTMKRFCLCWLSQISYRLTQRV